MASPYERIMLAAENETGLSLDAAEVAELSCSDEILDLALRKVCEAQK
jgi:hypothetical protein